MNISFTVESIEPDPAEECSRCHKIIIGKKYVPFVQVGFITDTKALDINWCEDCYREISNEKSTNISTDA